MTKTRLVYLQNNYTLADSGEFVFDLGSHDIVTRLDVQVKGTNGATNNKAATAADVITSVELMDGSTPIISATGAELLGMCSYKLSEFPQGEYNEKPAAVQYVRISHDFGRWYGDEQLALDLSKHANVQCRIKWNLAAVRAVGATGFVSGTCRLTVVAHVLEGGANPSGYLSIKRHALFATAASGIMPVFLPTDKTIRAIGIRSLLNATGMLAGISHIRLSGDSDKDRPIDLDTEDFLESLVAAYGRFYYKHVFHAQNTNVLYSLLKYHEGVSIYPELIAICAYYTNTGIGEGALIQFTTSTGVGLATDNVQDATIGGYLPFATGYLGFGAYDNPAQWLNAALYKQLKLELTQNVAAAACSVLVEQLNPYQ